MRVSQAGARMRRRLVSWLSCLSNGSCPHEPYICNTVVRKDTNQGLSKLNILLLINNNKYRSISNYLHHLW